MRVPSCMVLLPHGQYPVWTVTCCHLSQRHAAIGRGGPVYSAACRGLQSQLRRPLARRRESAVLVGSVRFYRCSEDLCCFVLVRCRVGPSRSMTPLWLFRYTQPALDVLQFSSDWAQEAYPKRTYFSEQQVNHRCYARRSVGRQQHRCRAHVRPRLHRDWAR